MKILIIDDESFDLFVVKKLLELEFEAAGFTSPPEALEWAKTNHFDVVLIDYYLTPNLLAHHVLKELLPLKEKNYKAFVLTNYVDNGQAKELRQAGFDAVIHKPLTLENFKEQLGM